MFKNYFKIAWRNLMKYKTFTFINIFGLSLSISFCMMLYMYIRYEQSFDEFHVKKDRLFRLETTYLFDFSEKKPVKSFFGWLTRNDEVKNQLSFAMQLAPDMQYRFPEIINMTGFYHEGMGMIKAANHVYKEGRVLYTDTNFFKSLSFHLVSGNPSTVLRNVNGAVISRSTALKYFGAGDPVGPVKANFSPPHIQPDAND